MSIVAQIEVMEQTLAAQADIIVDQQMQIGKLADLNHKLEARLEDARTCYREQAREIARLLGLLENQQPQPEPEVEYIFMRDMEVDFLRIGINYRQSDWAKMIASEAHRIALEMDLPIKKAKGGLNVYPKVVLVRVLGMLKHRKHL